MSRSSLDTDRSPLCVRRASIPVQGPPLRAIPAQSRALLCEHRDMLLSHLSRLGLQVNRGKSKLSPTQRISFLGMELDSVNLTARLSKERAQSMLRCLQSFQHKRAVPLKHFQRLLGHMTSSAAVTPLGLLHMRPLQRWLHDRVPRWAWCHGLSHPVLPPHLQPMVEPCFLRAGVPLEQVSRHVVVSKDASSTGWEGHVQRACSCGALDRALVDFVAAIAAHHDAVDGKSVEKHDLVIRFLRVARRLKILCVLIWYPLGISPLSCRP